MKKRRSSPEQLKIAGTERLDRKPDLESLAEEFRSVEDQFQGLREEKQDLAERLVEEMQRLGLEEYIYEDRGGELQRVSIAELDVKVTIRRVRKPRQESGKSEEARN